MQLRAACGAARAMPLAMRTLVAAHDTDRKHPMGSHQPSDRKTVKRRGRGGLVTVRKHRGIRRRAPAGPTRCGGRFTATRRSGSRATRRGSVSILSDTSRVFHPPRTDTCPETEGFPDNPARHAKNVRSRLHSRGVWGAWRPETHLDNQRPGRPWCPRLLGRSGAWRGVFLPSTAGPGPTGPGVPGQPGVGRRTVDSTALVIALLIVFLVVIDRVVRR